MSLDPRVQEVLDQLEAAANHKLYSRMDFFNPVQKQLDFIDCGADYRERVFMAANRTGKSETGAFETACHLTGLYPEWWMGKRFEHPTRGWAAGKTSEQTRDVVQAKLCGEPGAEENFGKGMIPKRLFIERPALARGIPDLFDTIFVRHITGGVSVLKLKSFEQGREKWQGDTLDFLWLDEEAPVDIYSEGLTRVKPSGIAYMTYTPLLGDTDITMKFRRDPSPSQKFVSMTLADATFWTKEDQLKMVEGYPEHEREARVMGLPLQGEGMVFKTSLMDLYEDGYRLEDIPPHWLWLWGIDFGIAHPFAAVLGVWDRDGDVVHILAAIRQANTSILQHAAAMKPYGVINVAWPQDGHQRDAAHLKTLASQYKEAGLRMRMTHAKHPDGTNSTEAGISLMDERFRTKRLRVARHLTEWADEYTSYHRENGLLVKKRDDLMSATRTLITDLRHAAPRLQGVWMLKEASKNRIDPHEGDPFYTPGAYD